MTSIFECVEGDLFTLEPNLGNGLRVAAERLRRQIRPRLRILEESDGQFAIHGVVGSIEIAAGATLEVSPKTRPGDDWIRSVLDLLIGTDRIDAAGERAAGLSPQRRDLLEVLAALYAARLERALRRDGPILLIERERATLSHLKGKLRVTQWVRHATWQPHRFPVAFDRLTAENDFSRGLASVARLLALAVRSTETRGRLLAAARDLRPGLAEDVPVDRRVAGRRLPAQWMAYAPAWSIARAILSQRSLLGASGSHHGVSIAIELWPLLERLLERSLLAAARIAHSEGRTFESVGKRGEVLLSEPGGSAQGVHGVEPDGRLLEGSTTIATFEAKYKRRAGADAWPPRNDVFQALATAAACGSPLSVLVYPESFPPAWWTVEGFSNRPLHLAAIGLGLFSYRIGLGDEERGRALLDLLEQVPSKTGVPMTLSGV